MEIIKQKRNWSNLLHQVDTSDLIFQVGGERFYCHKEVFTKSNGFFKALLGNSFAEYQKRIIILNDVSPELFRAVRGYLYTGDVAAVVSWENVVLMFHQAKMFCLEDMKEDIIGFVIGNLSGDKCWELCNATYSPNESPGSELFQTTIDWILKHIPNTTIEINYKNASKEVALLFLKKCLNSAERNPYPLSLVELWEWTSLYEAENKDNLQEKNFLTKNLPGDHYAAVSRDHLNNHPFPLKPSDITTAVPFRSVMFNCNADTLKAYWDRKDRIFRTYFDYNSTVWQLVISSATIPQPQQQPQQPPAQPPRHPNQMAVALTLGTLRLSTRSGPESIQYIHRGTILTILNRSPAFSEDSEDLGECVSQLQRGEKLRVFLQNVSWDMLLDPSRGYIAKDRMGEHLMVKIQFPLVWDEKPKLGWWSN